MAGLLQLYDDNGQVNPAAMQGLLSFGLTTLANNRGMNAGMPAMAQGLINGMNTYASGMDAQQKQQLQQAQMLQYQMQAAKTAQEMQRQQGYDDARQSESMQQFLGQNPGAAQWLAAGGDINKMPEAMKTLLSYNAQRAAIDNIPRDTQGVPLSNLLVNYGNGRAANYNAIGNTGRTLNEATGDSATANPGLAGIYDAVQRANIGQSNAAAQASMASAQASLANAGSANQQIDFERGLIGDKRTGQVRPLMLNGQPLVTTGGMPKLNEQQANAVLFGRRMMAANDILNSLDGKYSPASVAAMNLPGIFGGTVNLFANSTDQQARQAQNDFLSAVLRKESGAAISAGEYTNARAQYFPQVGDSQQVIEQKAANRLRAIEGIRAGAGPGVSLFDDGSNAAPKAPASLRVSAAQPLKDGEYSKSVGRGAMPRIASDSDYNALPSGSMFIDPSGQQRRKP